MDELRERSMRATAVFLVTSGLLIGPSLVDVGASIPYIAALVVLTTVFGVTRQQLSTLPTVLDHDLGTYGRDFWLAPVVALILVLALDPSASPDELQALGGIAGLVGMVNYFVRPLYLGIYGLVRR